jgi:hypothetical protein
MAALAWNGLRQRVTIPSGATASEPFSTPPKMFGFTVHVGALDGVSPTLKLQALDPTDLTTWRDLFGMTSTGVVSSSPLTVNPNTATGISAALTGCGVFRWVASAAQNQDRVISMFFGMR